MDEEGVDTDVLPQLVDISSIESDQSLGRTRSRTQSQFSGISSDIARRSSTSSLDSNSSEDREGSPPQIPTEDIASTTENIDNQQETHRNESLRLRIRVALIELCLNSEKLNGKFVIMANVWFILSAVLAIAYLVSGLVPGR